MIDSKYGLKYGRKNIRRALPFMVFLPMVLNAQIELPVKNWTAPQYFQPKQAERESISKSGAQIQFSPNATSTTALIFVAVSPCRLVDTRGASVGFIGSTPFNGPYIPAQQTVAFPIQSATETATTAPTPCGAIPSIAQAYSLNLTLVPHPIGTAVNYVTMWPDNGSAIPGVSTVNDQQGTVVANSAIVPAGTNSGGIKVFAYGATDVIIDMNGFYAAPTDLSSNTAIGASALQVNSVGSYNTAVGQSALTANTTGQFNTAIGADALFGNSAGNDNTAIGGSALSVNIANDNTAIGFQALQENTTGGNNTAIGIDALQLNKTGIDNIAIGSAAAYLVSTSGSYNIHIGNQGGCCDDHTIKIGTQGTQSSALIGGIFGTSVGGGVPVYANNSGQLGTILSSQRFKERITDMGDSSSKLFQLRPVNFFYKPEYDDGSHLLQYGLIAEEVEKTYPEMVAYDIDGKTMTVKYQMLAPMLLNEVQKQNAEIKSQREEIRRQDEVNRLQEEQNRRLEDHLAALEAVLSKLAPEVMRQTGSQ